MEDLKALVQAMGGAQLLVLVLLLHEFILQVFQILLFHVIQIGNVGHNITTFGKFVEFLYVFLVEHLGFLLDLFLKRFL